MQRQIVIVIVIIVLAFVSARLYVSFYNHRYEHPLWSGELLPCPDSPNCVSSIEQGAYDKMEPIKYSQETWQTLPKIIEDHNGKITEQTKNYIHAEFKTAIWGFVDDVEFHHTDNRIHFRSASRLGHSDMGLNKKRMLKLKEDLNT